MYDCEHFVHTNTHSLFIWSAWLTISRSKLITLHNNFIILLLGFFSILLARTVYLGHELLNSVDFSRTFSVPSSYASSPLPSSAVQFFPAEDVNLTAVLLLHNAWDHHMRNKVVLFFKKCQNILISSIHTGGLSCQHFGMCC